MFSMNLLKPDVYDMFLHVLSIWASVATCMQMLMERVDLLHHLPVPLQHFFWLPWELSLTA